MLTKRVNKENTCLKDSSNSNQDIGILNPLVSIQIFTKNPKLCSEFKAFDGSIAKNIFSFSTNIELTQSLSKQGSSQTSQILFFFSTI